MSNTTKWSVAIIVIILIIAGIFYLQKSPTRPNNVALKIGVIIPLSGQFAVIGQELQNGVELAAGQLKEKGANISFVYEDDKFDLKEVVTVANKLINIDKVDMAVLFSVEEARPVAPIFDNNKIPLVVMYDSNAFLKNAGPYIFSNGFSTEKGGQLMADFAFNKLKLKNIAVVGQVDPWSEIISQSFQDQFKKDGGKIAYLESVQVGTSDFRSLISKIKNSKPDAIYFPLIPPDSVSFIQQIKQANLNIPMLSGDALIQDVIDAVGKASNGIYYTNAYSDNTQLPILYKNKYGKDPSALIYVASGFDGVMKIGQALGLSKDIKTVLDSVFGPTRSADRLEKIYQVKSGISSEVK